MFGGNEKIYRLQKELDDELPSHVLGNAVPMFNMKD